jgi:hypothetical protein
LTKTIHSIPQDIDNLFKVGCIPNEDNLERFLTNLKVIMIDRLKGRVQKDPVIRMSKLGTPDRKLWFDHNSPEPDGEVSNALKFLYGDIVEQLVLFLVKEAGHTVEEEQGKVEIDGVKGSKDAKIDGVTIDIKSASSFAFRKFATGSLFQDDPFGYVAQLSAYSDGKSSAFIAVNKENGQIAILDLEPIDMIEPKTRIARCKEVIVLPEPPKEKCYPEEAKPNGNKQLSSNCKYCVHKFKCWDNLRVFKYASSLEYLTEVVKTPLVQEILPEDA